MKRKYTYTFIIILSFILIACSEKEDVISPTHYDKVPKPKWESYTVDTTNTGKLKITLNWSVSSTENVRDYDLYRAVNSPVSFVSRTSVTSTLVDSLFDVSVDSVKVFYFITAKAQDRFVGEPSDIIEIIARK